jgi:hypothetical protein
MIVIVLAGVSLVVYSRQERIHPPTSSAAGATPGLNANWHAALSIDICGKVQSNLPANSNLTVTGIRTFGDGLIYIQPKIAGSTASKFEGKNANLGTFVANYPSLVLTSTKIQLPGGKAYTNGQLCSPVSSKATAVQRVAASGTIEIETWASPTAKGKVLTVPDPSAIHLSNGEMISVGFVVPGSKLPVPASRSALISLLGGGSTSSSSTTSTT